ncbi:MAG: 1-deoxy-D-xylulose-5-phosphate reductoisomerase [Candidatus Schmidhempelia sp.]|nr:1-deoxy-D-xylulose-5-phosphate reductoisomerase [Candidatus Schmidhempelia sp.]
MQNLTILGSTGSIGCSTLSVIKQSPTRYHAYALVGGRNVNKMIEQCLEFKPKYVAMADHNAANLLRIELKNYSLNTEVLSGEKAICDLAALPEVHQVMAAIVGAAGLTPTLAAIKQGKRVLLANKESLVTCGHLFMQAVKQYQAQLLPVDSEHNAIFQCLPASIQRNMGFTDLANNGIINIVLTGSGGPFRDTPLSELINVTPEQAVTHPNWSMGRKISIDSATMMNKGLEYIEARWLFNASAKEMEIIIHPQSIIHSMVRYLDGSVIAQLGQPDMCTPIAYAMSYPERMVSGVPPLDFCQLSELTFKQPDFNRYPCLKLAITAFESGQAATTILNAANEIAVDAFLHRQISFMDIAALVDKTLTHFVPDTPNSIEAVLDIDRQARQIATTYLTDFVSY